MEPVPARRAVISPDAKSEKQLVLVRDLANLYKSPCASCHPGLLDGASLPWPDPDHTPDPWYARRYKDEILERIRSSDETYLMPPYEQYKKKFSDRTSKTDPIVSLVNRLEEWYDTADESFDGKTPRTDVFYRDVAPMSLSQYMMTEDLGKSLTNIGSSIPDKNTMWINAASADTLDFKFAAAKELPETLDQTDLVSFDSAVLARTGVVSFAPTYPLYSDGARKMRHVRVPRGQSIRFDKTTQRFSIPANTRFYKTFLKEVIQKDGTSAYRKIETRLIVVRPDGPDAGDGSHTTNALYGTYVWDESESEATLNRDPLRNGQPFQDRMITYITDEKKAAEVNAGHTPDKEQALYANGATRTYAIPGEVRCRQCHMGSDSHSFILGFTPVQIKRRATGEGGTYEPTSEDELGQLQRLIDYGVITGVKSPDDILPLERSQGERKPRNDYELKAQAYMIGNCGGCHNPRGYPTIENPSLKPLLNFRPDLETNGGIFQFPLERTSPRITRSDGTKLPYISPSLIDYEPELTGANAASANPPIHHVVIDDRQFDESTTYYIAAPWRSLLYRVVDTPVMFATDDTLYPHMPLNAPGYDARLPKIMGDWMVSIPARLASQEPEYRTADQPYTELHPGDADYMAAADAQRLDLYHKGGPADVDQFGSAFLGASHQKTVFLGLRYQYYSPDTRDIVDHDLLNPDADPPKLIGDDFSSLPSEAAQLTGVEPPESVEPNSPEALRFYAAKTKDDVPDRPHWVVTDITDVPPPWTPRRTDWDSVLVPAPSVCQPRDNQDTCAETRPKCNPWQLTNCDSFVAPNADPVTCDPSQLNCYAVDRKPARVLKLLKSLRLTDDFVKFAQSTLPFGVWQEKPGCAFEGIRTISQLSDADKRPWMAEEPETAHVYEQSFGASVYGEICINCHGKNADSRGRQADNLMLITGGATRVANFRDGMFSDTGYARVGGPFKERERPDMSADDWGARYMAWMALGGTLSVIDSTILALVGNQSVLGRPRVRPDGDKPGVSGIAHALDGNMLAIAQTLCSQTQVHQDLFAVGLMQSSGDKLQLVRSPTKLDAQGAELDLVEENGDEEMWRRLCAYDNPHSIMVMRPGNTGFAGVLLAVGAHTAPTGYRAQARGYPQGAPIGDGVRGVIEKGVQAGNLMPYCIDVYGANDQETTANRDTLAKWVHDTGRDHNVPLCPDPKVWPRVEVSEEELTAWDVRGAINGGMAVFVYMRDVAARLKEGLHPQPTFDDCERLGEAAAH